MKNHEGVNTCFLGEGDFCCFTHLKITAFLFVGNLSEK